ncbi:ABC transporter ATP-binding protein [Candidatus Atribacteria bacterium HGW-Atribacteria-1]|nr:MAG: ABC transporter ATP-binding protein [Candidatus Atribacteria bacterium HGW-Atribacteria-1]
MSLLEVKDIESGYGRTSILYNINIEIGEGEMVTMVGPNGAGKTTLLRTISGILKVKKGQIIFQGKQLGDLKPNEVVQKGIGYVPQDNNVFPNLTVMENLEMGAYLLSESEFEGKLRDVFERFPILKERKKQRAGTLSGGERQMLAIASSLLLTPKLLMVDEPCGGLAPQVTKEVFSKILDIYKMGTTILWVAERDIESVLNLVSRSYVMESGEITFEGTGEELLSNKKFQELILAK